MMVKLVPIDIYSLRSSDDRETSIERYHAWLRRQREIDRSVLMEHVRMKNREKVKAYQKEYRIRNREKAKAYQKEYRIKNKEKIRKSKQEYRIKNKEKIREYYVRNRDKVKAYQREYMRNKAKKKPEKGGG